MADTYTGEVVRIALLAGDEGVIRDKEFANCDVYGPAVIFLGEETSIDSCGWDGDLENIVLEVPPERTRLIGVIHVLQSSFIGCRFHNIGIAALPVQIPIIKSGFGE